MLHVEINTFSSHHSTHSILHLVAPVGPGGNLAWSAGKRRRNVHTRIGREEIAWAQEDTHWLRGHDWVVFRGRKVDEAERMPEDNVGVIETAIGIGCNPRRNALGRLPGGLGNVSASGVDLIVRV